MKIKAVIFDMDGVLIDAKEWHYEALNKALSKFGYEISRHDHLVTFDGLPTRKKLEMLSEQDGLPRKLHQFINDLKQKYTMQIVNEKCVPNFIHQYALSQLFANGYKMAVASNSIRKTIDSMMDYADLSSFFSFYMSNEDVKNGKPDPEIYLKTIERLGLKNKECLIVEDNFNGIKAAKASGAHVLEVEDVSDVNYQNIMGKILQIEEEFLL